MNENRERRKDKRYAVKERVLASIRPIPEETYHVLDISLGGMAFRYLGESQRYNENLLNGNLLFEESGLTLENMSFVIISDQLMKDPFTPRRRCGVQFKNMSPTQHKHLIQFIAQAKAETGPN